MPPLLLRDAIRQYLVICQAEGSPAQSLHSTRETLTRLETFVGDLETAELEPLHVLLFFTAQRIVELRIPDRSKMVDSQSSTFTLLHFLRWLDINQLVEPQLLGDLKKNSNFKSRHLPGKKTKNQHPPDDGGC